MNWSEILWSILSAIITALIGYLVTKISIWIGKKVKNEKLANLLIKATGLVGDTVKVVYQDFVESYKTAGTFTPEKQKEAKEKAMKMIQSELTPEIKSFINEQYGDDIAWISNQIEVAIYNFKNK